MIRRIHAHLRHDACDRDLKPTVFQFLLKRPLQMEPDVSLRHGRAFREGHPEGLLRLFGIRVHSLVDHAYLRPVSVAYDDLVPGFNEVRDRFRRINDGLFLFFRRMSQCIAAKRGDDP